MEQKNAFKKKQLYEISFIKPLLIVMLVLYHAFAIYDGQWSAPDGFNNISAYSWVSKISYSFMLEMFVFVSGYLWAYSYESKEKNLTFYETIKNKFSRLIIPCIVFSVIYVIMFRERLNISVLDAMGGVGHLWFLVMLFWCFVLGYPIVRLQINVPIKLLFLFLLSCISIIPLPFRLSSAFQYLFFFIGGYYSRLNKIMIVNRLESKKVLLWILFFLTFISSTYLNKFLSNTLLVDNNNLIAKSIYIETKLITRQLFSILGVLAIYVSAVSFTTKHKLFNWYVELGKLCMGVYIFQQFFLQYIIYYTQLPTIVGFILLPWISFIIALLFSIALSYTVKHL